MTITRDEVAFGTDIADSKDMMYNSVKKISILFSLLLFITVSGAFAAPKAAELQAQTGLIAEHVKNLNTLALSFVDISQPIYAIKLQILKEFLNNSESPQLLLLVSDERDIKNTNALVKQYKPAFDLKKITYVKAESTFISSSWIRDFSPVMVRGKNGELSLVKFNYVNESDYTVDQLSLGKALKLPVKKIDLRLEGGNILSDEAGRLFVSTAVVENNLGENPTLTEFNSKKSEIEKTLLSKLLAREVVWVPRVKRELEGTGHVDMYLRLLSNGQAVVAESDNRDINNTLDEIAKIVALKGYKVTRLKANSKIQNKFRNQNVFPSYTNSILVGKSIFIPQYHVDEDKVAVSLYRRLGYKVIQIDGESIHFGGSVHCLTYLYP